MFNFEINAEVVEQSSASVSKTLKGGQIHRVKLIEVKEEQIKVKARPAANGYPAREAYTDTVLTIVVGNEEGTYTDRFFSPDETAGTRKTNDKGNLQPSPLEQMTNKFTQYLIAFRPKFMEQVKAGEKTFGAKDWASFRKLIVKTLAAAINKGEVFLKLLKNNSGYAETPRFPAAMGKDKETNAPRIFTGSVFIHHDQAEVSFSDFETQRLNAVATAKPSNMGGGSEDEDLDPDLEDDDLTDLDEDDDLPL